MGRLSAKLRSVERGVAWWCPGCDGCHVISTKSACGSGWDFDGNVEAPTFSPSVLVTYDGRDAGQPRGDGDHKAPPARCHCFVKSGQIVFLGDCTHELASKTVPMPDWPYAEGEYGGV